MNLLDNSPFKRFIFTRKGLTFVISAILGSVLTVLILLNFLPFTKDIFNQLFPKSASKAAVPVELICSFTGPTTLVVDEVGTFSSTSTGNISSYAWSATWSPDGKSPVSGIASTFRWSGPTPGIYTVSLTVSNLEQSKSCQTDVTIK